MECTSGNVGVALAMVAAARGYRFVAVMGDDFSVERRKVIRAYGGKVILFPAVAEGSAGGRARADELGEKHGWFRSRQFDNPADPAYHRETTAAEILSDFAGKRLDYFVCGFGTSGTLTGFGQMLKLARPDVRVVTPCDLGHGTVCFGDGRIPKVPTGRGGTVPGQGTAFRVAVGGCGKGRT
ncbi:pyridoxal-phosphate dependent enzyme [Streptomyces sp. RerS4]|uniref:pyridoxal-phosphate dependent enzyme n=1 Tax=Streptomyces sp. RerS4 TaxID=2942449 RepID=UPI0024C05743|nr:pyridoxal-phosphate dependent enzyme [Streptomyces sp. RerS4]